jgi:dye decolorizing peroxidase
MSGTARGWGRRAVLRTGAAALGGAGTGWSAAELREEFRHPRTAEAPAAAGAPDPVVSSVPELGNQTVPFHGLRQSGVATAPQAHLSLLGLDLLRAERGGLERLMRLLSDDGARLSRGLPALADTEPELAARPARLTVTFGFGPKVMRDLLPDAGGVFEALPAFGTDRLDPVWGQTDVVVQICADDPLTVAHARRMVLKDCAGLAELRWVQHGFRRAAGAEPVGTTMRNVMGQVDGTVNPGQADPDFDGLVWRSSDPLAGGTVMVVRRIRARMEAWDEVDRAGREAAVGRRLDNGAPLTGTREHDDPAFEATDRLGLPVIDPASHIARARSDDPAERFLRRGYNYTVPDPSQPSGEDSGLVFIAFAADVHRQFVPVQRRLAELDRLNQWVTAIGSAVYAVPPGAPEGEFVGQRLLGTAARS